MNPKECGNRNALLLAINLRGGGRGERVTVTRTTREVVEWRGEKIKHHVTKKRAGADAMLFAGHPAAESKLQCGASRRNEETLKANTLLKGEHLAAAVLCERPFIVPRSGTEHLSLSLHLSNNLL